MVWNRTGGVLIMKINILFVMISMIFAISINSTVSAENKNTDVWAYSSMVTGEWGRVLVIATSKIVDS